MSDFDQAIPYILKHEGSEYTDIPQDKGGPTKWGIIQSVLAQWRGHEVTKQDVQNLELEEAKKIYEAYYWNPLNLTSLLDQKIATIIFDQGVNFGISVAGKRAQKACNKLGAVLIEDGKIGPKSIYAINQTNPVDFYLEFIKESQMHYARIVSANSSQAIFLKGWLSRTHDLLDYCFKV
jgi:Putative secretion activating protein